MPDSPRNRRIGDGPREEASAIRPDQTPSVLVRLRYSSVITRFNHRKKGQTSE